MMVNKLYKGMTLDSNEHTQKNMSKGPKEIQNWKQLKTRPHQLDWASSVTIILILKAQYSSKIDIFYPKKRFN